MVATAAVLEEVGVSAYLGAAPLLADPAILGTAGSILSIEARHQTLIRIASGMQASPSAFDAPLGALNVFSLAAPFIKSCPEGSNLALTAFPALTLADPADPKAPPPKAGDTLPLLCREIYGSASCYLRVAQVNALDDFRNLTVGQELIFPPFDTAVSD